MSLESALKHHRLHLVIVLRFDCELQVMNFQMNQSITFQQKGFWAHWDTQVYIQFMCLLPTKNGYNLPKLALPFE